jgi:hypothetical protein
MKISTVKENPPLLFTLWSILVLIMLMGAVAKINLIMEFLGSSEDAPQSHSVPGLHYYFMLQIIVCGWAIFGIFLNRKRLRQKWLNADRFQWGGTWFWIFLLIAILFNPIFTPQIGKDIWGIIDLLVIGVVILSFFLFKPYKMEIFCTKCDRVLNKGFYLAKKHSFSWESPYYDYNTGLEFCVPCLIDMLKNNYENDEEEIEVDYLSDIEQSAEKYVQKSNSEDTDSAE